jgi:hypothetical protein
MQKIFVSVQQKSSRGSFVPAAGFSENALKWPKTGENLRQDTSFGHEDHIFYGSFQMRPKRASAREMSLAVSIFPAKGVSVYSAYLHNLFSAV